jgi:carbamoyltransferase
MQHHLETEILRYVGRFREVTGARHLYYSGGAALNIHANTRIEGELDFESVSIPPAPSDAGLALGAAAFLEWKAGCPVRKHSAFLNHLAPHVPSASVPQGLPVLHSEDEVASAMADGKLVGVWVGDAELGPRALGHRSLLARPDSVDLRRKLSETVKHREWYRPVAPMMLQDVAEKALKGYKPGSALARYMLGAWSLRPAWVQAFWGCVHADGTVRAQVVDDDAPELSHIHRLLDLLQQRHGIHGVINTSFNRRGEPIVQTLDEALSSALAMGIDALWLP